VVRIKMKPLEIFQVFILIASIIVIIALVVLTISNILDIGNIFHVFLYIFIITLFIAINYVLVDRSSKREEKKEKRLAFLENKYKNEYEREEYEAAFMAKMVRDFQQIPVRGIYIFGSQGPCVLISL